MRLRLVAAAVAALWLAAPAIGAPGKVAIGLDPGASALDVAAAVATATGGFVESDLAAIGAVVATVADVDGALATLGELPGVAYVERVSTRRLSFAPDDPLLPQQWHLPVIKAFDAWQDRPALDPVLVAVVDSGIDGDHPDLGPSIEAARSFVSSPAREDTIGHGTMVAGLVAAAVGNGEGVAGVAFPARLLVAKVVDSDGTISLDAEARAIRWAADQGAKVINLSLGGPRDPTNPDRDTYSQLEQDAVEYAYTKGAVVVAATGNCDAVCPYGYASYPAALPHVLGVGALDQRGAVPRFSNRDTLYVDLVAPGVGIVSTFPRDQAEPGCAEVGYTPCAPIEYRRGEGTSFATPLVSAAAAIVRAIAPELRPDQVMALLVDSAVDLGRRGRDAQTGRGLLDVRAAVERAVAGTAPVADLEEVNDDAGARAARAFFAERSPSRLIAATLDYFDDRTDVYAVLLRPGQQFAATLRSDGGPRLGFAIWSPVTDRIDAARPLVFRDARRGRAYVVFTARQSGLYFVSVRMVSGGRTAYRLRLVRAPS